MPIEAFSTSVIRAALRVLPEGNDTNVCTATFIPGAATPGRASSDPSTSTRAELIAGPLVARKGLPLGTSSMSCRFAGREPFDTDAGMLLPVAAIDEAKPRKLMRTGAPMASSGDIVTVTFTTAVCDGKSGNGSRPTVPAAGVAGRIRLTNPPPADH